MRKNFSLLLTPVFIFVLVTLLWSLILNPFLEGFIQKLVTQQVNKTQITKVQIEETLIQLFPPRIIFNDIQLTPRGELTSTVAPLLIDQFSLEINAFKLLIGRVEINRLGFNKVKVQVQLDPLLEKQGPSQEIPVQKIFQLVEQFPVRQLEIKDLDLELLSHRLNLQINTLAADLTLKNLRNNITYELISPEIVLNQANYIQTFKITGLGQITPQDLMIDDLTFSNGDFASLDLTGVFKNWKTLTTSPNLDFQTQGYIDLSWIDKQLVTLLKKKSLGLQGSVELQQRVLFNKHKLSSDGKIAYQDVVIQENSIGDGSGGVTYVDSQIILREFAINHPAGNAVVKKFDLMLDQNLSFSGWSQIQKLDLQKLFLSIGLTQVPTWLDIKGRLTCKGQFTSPFDINCNVDATAENLKVASGMSQSATVIAEIPRFSAQGDVTITNQHVRYSSQIQIESNQGQSSGLISYEKGFEISYETPRLDFKNLKSLIGLRFEGATSIKGSTRGNASAATFNMQAGAKDFVLENYHLGQFEASIDYAQGQLNIDEILGAFQKSQYLGSIRLDLNQSQISGRVSAPVLDSEDLLKILDHLFVIPFSITGMGKAEFDFAGPLNFWKLNFKLKGLFNEIRFAKDRFDLLNIEAKAEDGVIYLSNVYAQRNQSRIAATGKIGPEQALDLKVKTENLRLEDSLLVSSLNSNFFGILVGDAAIQGSLKEPEVNLKAQIKNSVFSEQELPDSLLNLVLNKDRLALDYDLLGGRLRGDLKYPLSKSGGPLQVNATSEEWQASTFLNFLTGAEKAEDFSALISGNIQLLSKSGHFEETTGSIQITKAEIQKSGQKINNPKPMILEFNEGKAQLIDFLLKGDGNEVSLSGRDFKLDQLNIRLDSNLDLKFLHVLMPFLTDINGPSQVSAQIRGSLLSPEIFGTAELNNSFIRLKGFPHPVEKIRSEISFSQNRVIVNQIKAQMAGGTLSGDGTLQFLGLKNLPANLRLRMENVSLNVPDQVRTQGYGELLLSGNWFPYTLGGSYRIQNANIEKEFTENIASGQIKQSIYLPKVLREEVFEPLTLDLQIITEKPLAIKNSLLDGASRGNLQVKGTPTNPILLGKATIEKDTKLNIKDKIFEIQTGTVTFNDPNEVNPDLFITAQSRVSDYEINVLVQGSSKNPNIRLTSIPPLSDQDIISLLALGVTSSQLDQNIQSKDQQAQTGYEIGAAILSNNPLSKNLQDRLGVNLQFTSAYDSTRNIAVPKFTVSRRITDRLNASASRTLGDQTTVDVKLQLMLKKNLSAIGTWEDREINQSSETLTDATQRQNQSVFGLDLEYKVEFK